VTGASVHVGRTFPALSRCLEESMREVASGPARPTRRLPGHPAPRTRLNQDMRSRHTSVWALP